MSYDKKILLAVAFCATLGLHSAGAVKFNNLTEPQKMLIKNIETMLEDAVGGLTSIDDYVNRCIERFKSANNLNKIEAYTQKGLLNLVRLYQDRQVKDALTTTEGVDNKELKVKEVAGKSVWILSSYICGEFSELMDALVISTKKILGKAISTKIVSSRHLTEAFKNKDVKFFKKFSNKLTRINEIIQNVINFENNDNDWADFLFGDQGNKKRITVIPDDGPSWEKSLFCKEIAHDKDTEDFDDEDGVSGKGGNEEELTMKKLDEKMKRLDQKIERLIRLEEERKRLKEKFVIIDNEKQELRDRLLEELDLLCADFPKDLLNIEADNEK
jgi:hypothetical protein